MEEKTPQLIYLDNNATTRVDPAVFEAMVPWLRDEYGNPSSTYPLGARASQAINEARANVAGLLGCEARDIIFTSCGTESINTAILSALALDRDKTHIITSAVEHSATIKLCEHLATRGYEITWLPVNSEGQIDLAKLESSIREDTALVSLLWANNETGVLFPIEEIARITTAKKVPLHVDAVQAAGKLPLNVSTLGAQFVSISGHKLHCPKGVGALYVSRRIKYTPLLRGSQEEERRGGTQNVASIVGLGKAAAVAAEHLNAGEDYVRAIRDHFENRVLAEVPGASRNGHATERLPNTANLAFAGIESEGALMLLADSGICCSAGSACTSGSVNPSHVLKAMGFSNDHARGSLRFSFGRFNTMEEADFAATEVARVTEKLRSLRSAGPVAMAS